MLLTLTKKIKKLKKENLKMLMKKLQIVLTQEKQKWSLILMIVNQPALNLLH